MPGGKNMRMSFKKNEKVTIVFGTEKWEISKQKLADFLIKKCRELDGTDNSCTLESALILGYLPLTDTIEVSATERSSIKIEHIVANMEVDTHLKEFLITR